MLVGREPAKMRPSKDLTTCGRWVLVRPGSSSVMARLPATPVQWSTRVSGRSRAPLVTRLGGQGSQRAAQQETLPLLAHAVHVGGLVGDQRHTRDDRRSG